MVIADFYKGYERGEEEASLGFPPAYRYYNDPNKGDKAKRAYTKGYIAGFDSVLQHNLTSRRACDRVIGEE